MYKYKLDWLMPINPIDREDSAIQSLRNPTATASSLLDSFILSIFVLLHYECLVQSTSPASWMDVVA